MQTDSQTPRPAALSSSLRPLYPAWLLLILVFVLLMIFVKPVAVGGDSAYYANDVERSLPHGWGETHELWNFAHVLWRPLGRLLAEGFLPALAPHFSGNANMAIGFLLLLPNLISAPVCALILLTMIWKITGNRWASFLAAVAFLCLNPLLHYSRLGSPYIFGITCTTLATYLIGFHSRRSWGTAILAGALSGIAVLCWAPFLVSFPAILLSSWILDRQTRLGTSRVRFSLLVCLSAACVVAAFYAFAMAVAGIHGVAGLLAWIHESAPDSKESKALRMLTGLVRGFYDVGDFAVWLKWYVFHDPYAQVGIADLMRASMARIALFYTALLGLLVLLWSSPLGRRLLLFIAVAALPHIAIAVGYESSGVERYVGFLPALFLGFGYLVGTTTIRAARRVAAGLLCCAHIPFNLASASDRNIGNVLQRDPARLEAVLSVAPSTHLYVLNTFDPLFALVYGEPLDPRHRRRLPSVDTIPPFGRIPLWRRDFACTVLSASDQGAEVWVTKRVFSPQPQRNWLWVERDEPGLSWSDLHAYFSSFDAAVELGGPDGFFRVSPAAESRHLREDIEAPGPACEQAPLKPAASP